MRVSSCGLVRKREGVDRLGRAGGVKAGAVSVPVIGSPFGDGRMRSGRWEEHNQSQSMPASISQYAETRNGFLAYLMV